jgi:hypothetical protein
MDFMEVRVERGGLRGWGWSRVIPNCALLYQHAFMLAGISAE